MRPVVVSREATIDIARLEIWLLLKGAEAAAARLGDVLADAIASLSEMPDRGRRGGLPSLRELVVPFGNSAYLIQYRVEAQRVVVARIRHSRERR